MRSTLVLGICLSIAFAARGAGITLGPRTPVSPQIPGNFAPSNAVADPVNADRLLVGGSRIDPLTAAMTGVVYYSEDGGRSWSQSLEVRTSKWMAEASIGFGPDGEAYYAVGASDTSGYGLQHQLGRATVYSSTDYGKHWSTLKEMTYLDWTRLVVDSTDGPNRGNVYIFSNWDFSISDRSSFAPALMTIERKPGLPVRSAYGSLPQVNGLFPLDSAVLSDGTALSVFSGYSGEGVVIASSRDAGKSLVAQALSERPPPVVNPVLAKQTNSDSLIVAWSEPLESAVEGSRVFIARSLDKARTWKRTQLLTATESPLIVPPRSTLDVALNKDGVAALMWTSARENAAAQIALIEPGSERISQIVPLGAVAWPQRKTIGDWGARGPVFLGTMSMRDGKASIGMQDRGYKPDHGIGALLVADVAGNFHAFWHEYGSIGGELWTRTLSLASARREDVDLEGLVDLTEMTSLQLSNVRFNVQDSTFAIDVTPQIRRPITVSDIVLVSEPPANPKVELTPANASVMQPDGRAIWRVSREGMAVTTTDVLPKKTLIFKVDPNHPLGSSDAEWIRGVRFPIQLYGRRVH